MKEEAERKKAELDQARNDKVGMEIRLSEMDWLKDPQSAAEFPDWPGLYGSLDPMERREFDEEYQRIKDTIRLVDAED